MARIMDWTELDRLLANPTAPRIVDHHVANSLHRYIGSELTIRHGMSRYERVLELGAPKVMICSDNKWYGAKPDLYNRSFTTTSRPCPIDNGKVLIALGKDGYLVVQPSMDEEVAAQIEGTWESTKGSALSEIPEASLMHFVGGEIFVCRSARKIKKAYVTEIVPLEDGGVQVPVSALDEPLVSRQWGSWQPDGEGTREVLLAGDMPTFWLGPHLLLIVDESGEQYFVIQSAASHR